MLDSGCLSEQSSVSTLKAATTSKIPRPDSRDLFESQAERPLSPDAAASAAADIIADAFSFDPDVSAVEWKWMPLLMNLFFVKTSQQISLLTDDGDVVTHFDDLGPEDQEQVSSPRLNIFKLFF